MKLKECYAMLDGDYESAVSHLSSDALVEKFLYKFLDDKSYNNLVSALDEQNFEEAFRAAHTLKGVCQNLSFTKLGASSSALTEALRGDLDPSYLSLAAQVKDDYEQTVAAIALLRSENT